MSQQIDVLHSESNTIHQFCMDWLLTIYKTLMARDVKTATAFWSILTMHHGKQTLNCHVCDTVAQLETTVGQPAFTDTLPPPFLWLNSQTLLLSQLKLLPTCLRAQRKGAYPLAQTLTAL